MAQTLRKWEDLNATEQQEVRDSFVTAQVAKGVEADVVDLRATISELMEENDISFEEALELDDNASAPHIALPAIKLNDSTQSIPQLDQFATLNEIQNAISLGGEIEPGWISAYTAADHNRSDGFIVHVSEIAEGERPTPAQLQGEADGVRQRELRNVNPLREEVTLLRDQLYLQQLHEKQARIAEDIELAEREVAGFQAASANGQEVATELAEASQSLARLKQQQSTHLPAEITRLQDGKGIRLATTQGGSSWRNYAIAALVILLILSFMGGDKDKKKIAATTAAKSSEPIDVESTESSADEGEEKKSDS